MRDGRPITHATLDALPPRPSVNALRYTLVHLGALPQRHEALERLPGWLNHLLATVETRHRPLLRRYAVWSVLRRARRHAQRRRFTADSAANARTKITAVANLLAWIDIQQLTLATLTQPDIDRWLDQPGATYYVTSFLRWAHRQGIVGDLHAPYPQTPEPTITMNEDTRWQLLHQCLHHETVPVDVRAAGALLLLYGLPLTRIIELRTDQLTDTAGHRYLTIDRHRALVPPAIARQLDALPVHISARSLAGDAATTVNRWLFPGRQAGRPISAGGLGNRIRQHGIDIRAARNAALITLAAELPPAVLADLLGISITSAVKWARRAARDWTPYLQARAESLQSLRNQPDGQ